MFRLGACVEMMKITRGFQSWFVMATFIQAWYVWVVTRGIGTSRKLHISNWEWAPWYGSYEWGFCSYGENSWVIVEIALEFLRVVTKKLDNNVSFVKTTNLVFIILDVIQARLGIHFRISQWQRHEISVGGLWCICAIIVLKKV
jgi:hypothetical protein